MLNLGAFRLISFASFQVAVEIAYFPLLVEGEMCSAMTSATDCDDLAALRDKTFSIFQGACRAKKGRTEESNSCSFSSVGSNLRSFTFILKPLIMPLRLDFKVKTMKDARIALAENKREEDIFAEMTIGGSGNQWTVIRACYYEVCPEYAATHYETGLLDVNEYRSFWIEYKEGVVKVGKGGQEEAFLNWDAGAYHRRVPSQVHVGIASWDEPIDWVFYQFCQ